MGAPTVMTGSMLPSALVVAGLLAAPVASAQDAASPVAISEELPIDRAGSRHEWPFSVDRGSLTCVTMDGQRVVIFSEPWPDVPIEQLDVMKPPRSVIVSVNVMLLLASIEDRSLYLPFDSLETLIRRLAPFETMGRALCDKDAATPQTKN